MYWQNERFEKKVMNRGRSKLLNRFILAARYLAQDKKEMAGER
jgi:hypothetical protein